MKGTEKQIKWAEDILTSTTSHIDQMIAFCESNKAYTAQVDAWKYMQERYSVMLQNPKFQDAAFVINNRSSKVFRTDAIMSDAETMAGNLQLPLVDALKKIIG